MKNTNKHLKIGILTYHRACNYGAFLQARALCNRLNAESDIEAEIIDFCMKKERDWYSINRCGLKRTIGRIVRGNIFFDRRLFQMFHEFQEKEKFLKSKEYLESDNLDDFVSFVKGKYDIIISGSDEIWKTDGFRGFPTPYWLIGDLTARKFAYAVSARMNFKKGLCGEKYEMLKMALKDYEYIGVRDIKTYLEVTGALGDEKKVHMCCDPSFLWDFEIPQLEVKDNINKLKRIRKERKNILVMTENRRIAHQIYLQLHKKVNLISVFHKHFGYISIADLNPYEWLAMLKNADFVITSYFHAACYSIVLNVPFVALGTETKKSKLEELLGDSRLQSNYMDITDGSFKNIKWEEIIKRKIDTGIFQQIAEEKKKSFESFLEALRVEL